MLLNLNDDCLLHIFQFLTLKDQIHLAEICQRFKLLLEEFIWPKNYADINTQMRSLQSLTLQEYKNFLRFNQENIKKLKIEDTNNFAYVYNTTRLNEQPHFSFYFGLKMPKLKEFICPNAKIHDRYLELLTINCPNLEYIILGDSLLTGKYLSDFKYLKRIVIGKRDLQMPLMSNVESILTSTMPLEQCITYNFRNSQ